MKKKYLITSALPYANGPVHIGHLAGVYLPADIFSKYLKINGHEVLHVCGSDQYGAAIVMQAKKEGRSADSIANYYHNHILSTFSKFGINFDIYSKTSSLIHKKNASNFFSVLYEKKILFKKKILQYFDCQVKEFLADRYITGQCPYCNFDGAYGDQCERCGTSLTSELLINPCSRISSSKPILKESEHWYFPLDLYQTFLQEWIDTKKNIFKDAVYGQCKSWLNQGLSPRAITRDLSWGIQVPIDGYKEKVIYVWFEAPIGYISATEEAMALRGESADYYWKDKNTELIHFIGKDNIVFHCLIFPAMLEAHGSYILPSQVFANEFLNLEGKKISTSKNWAVWLHEYMEDFPNQQDALRYVLCCVMPENKDADFSWKDFQAKNNNELIAVLGNYVNRCVVLLARIFNAFIPEKGTILSDDLVFMNSVDDLCLRVGKNLTSLKFKEALFLSMNVARLGNKYLADQKPWEVYKHDVNRARTLLNISFQVLYKLMILFYPFLTNFSCVLAKCLSIDVSLINWENLPLWDAISVGKQVTDLDLIFNKVEDIQVEFQMNKLKNKKQVI